MDEDYVTYMVVLVSDHSDTNSGTLTSANATVDAEDHAVC
jgi:hypothetical protein